MNNGKSIKFLIGESTDGETIYGNFTESGSFVSCGHVGSGHSSYDEGAFVTDLLKNYTPEELKFVMIDPKQVQLNPYKEIAHLWRPIAFMPNEARQYVSEIINELNQRLEQTSSDDGITDSKPALLLLVTEIADLMMVDQGFYEQAFLEIATKGKAVGIYLYIATQRPSEDVLTESILRAISGRLVFAVASEQDSIRLLSITSAVEIKNQGELLFVEQLGSKPLKVQAPYITDENITKVINSIEA